MEQVDLTALLLMLLGGLPNTAPPPPPLQELTEIETEPWGGCLVDEAPSPVELAELRARRSDLFGYSAQPLGPRRLAGEFETAHTLYLSYLDYPQYQDIFADIIAAARSEGEVAVLVAPSERRGFLRLLRSRGIARDAVSIIDDVPYDTIWFRDYGPTPVVTERGLAFVDGRYYVNCLRDDSVPTRLAQRQHYPVHRPDLWIEGGNLISDGRGLCLTTTALATQNRGGRSRAAAVLRQYYGCERTVFLQALVGNVIEHIDMFVYFADAETILVGELTPEQSPANHAVLAANRRVLASLRTPAGLPYRIISVPMPDPAVLDAADPEGPLVRSNLNMLVFNEVVLVPDYSDFNRHSEQALQIIQEAFPERYVMPIAVDALAADGGTIHCITRTLPLIVQR